MSEIKAVLVRLTIRIFPNTRQDAEITEEVRLKKSLGIGAGKWVKHVFPDEAFADIREKGGEARRRHYDLTLPWEEGYRLLPAGAHTAYEKDMEAFKTDFLAQVDAFRKDYPDWVKKSKAMHNGTFNPDLYPEWLVMKKHFEFGAEFSPVPKSSHFITGGIAKGAIDDMREDLERRNAERVEAAVSDTWNRLFTPVQKIAEKLAGKETIFRDSLIENVKEVVALIPSLNLTNDTDLVRIAKEIEEKFAALDPEVLRENLDARKEASKAAKALVAQFGKIGKRRFA
jgi:hypothetical protein